jgi:hypothetical protein
MHLSRPSKTRGLRDLVMYAVYDLATAPPSYEVISFLLLCEFARLSQGLAHTHVLFVPGPDNGFRGNKKEIPREANEWRRDHILGAACGLVGATYSFLPDPRAMLEYEDCFLWQPGWRAGYRRTWYGHGLLMKAYESIQDFPDFAVAPFAAQKVREWTKGQPYITVTQRNAHAALRNSKPEIWDQFAEWVRGLGYQVYMIPDTNDAGSCDPVGAIASIDLRFRHALYAGAVTNFGINTGPMVLCFYGKLPFIACHMTSPDWKATTPEYMAQQGMPVGSQFPGARSDQVLVWEDENLPMLQREFTRQIELKMAA